MDEVLPAYAGMIHHAESETNLSFRAPRVCGDDPRPGGGSLLLGRCSPRMRG